MATSTQRSVLGRRLVGTLGRRALPAVLLKQQLARRDQFAATGTVAGRIVFLGDSISEFGNWHEWFPAAPLLNRGIGGETSSQVHARLDTAIAGPRGVLLLIGTNDLSLAVPPEIIGANVARILAGIERRAPGTPVVVQSVMPRGLKYRDEVLDLNERYRAIVAAAPGDVRYLDLWPALATPEGALRPEYTRDDLHLNGEGYRAWVEVLRPVMTELEARA